MSSILPLNISKPETKKYLRKISSTKLFYIFIYILYILLYTHLLSLIISLNLIQRHFIAIISTSLK